MGRDPAIHWMARRVGGIEWAPGSSPGVTQWVGRFGARTPLRVELAGTRWRC